ncbi:acetoacetyl-CoA synthetase [Trichonephila clavipes]|nr:acetoacetyl-CoA synthetase [Trichonephila clavipes]
MLIFLDEEGRFEEITYAQLFEEVKLYAAAFRKNGLRNGDLVCCMMNNRKEAVIGCLAAASIGAMWTGIQVYYGAKTAAKIANRMEPKFFLAPDGFFVEDLYINLYEKIPIIVEKVRRLQNTDISSYQQKEQAHHSSAGGKSVSCCLRKADLPKNCCQTFGGGLYARRPVVCVPLTRQHRTARLQWCCEHHNWTEQDWACVLFSDESRFSLSSDCRRQLIWRESGTAYRPENIQEKDRYPTCSIMV